MRVSRDELLATLNPSNSGSVSASIPINPLMKSAGTTATNFLPWLAGLASSWERIIWHTLEVSWRPSVGTTTNGIIAYGVDWDPKKADAAPTRAQVTSLTPVKDHPIWQATDSMPLRAARNMLQSRKHYILRGAELLDSCPGSILVSVINAPKDLSSLGELWCRYDVTLLGPKSATG